jgi:hypothetical protein
MDNTDKSLKNTNDMVGISTNIKVGIYSGLGLIFYFVIMRLFNLHHIMELHYVNILVLFIGLRYAIKQIISIKGEIKYFEGLKSGIVVTIISLVIFNIFMVLYETIIDPSFLDFLKENIHLGKGFSTQETIFNVMGILTIEGLSSGFIMTFILMQYYKAESSETK